MLKKFISSVVLGLCLAASVKAQPDLLWARTYGRDNNTENANSLILTDDGGFAIAGTSYDSRVGRVDGLMMRANSDGDSLWLRTYGAGAWYQISSLIQTTDGRFALNGYLPGRGFFILRLDENGDSLWLRTYGDYGKGNVIQTINGGFALVADSTLVVTDDEGEQLFSQTFGLGTFYSIIQTPDGGFALAGRTFSNAGSEFLLLRTNENGDSLWSRTFGGKPDAYCLSLIQTADGGFALAGWANCGDDSYAVFWLVRTDSSGDSIWTRLYNGYNQNSNVTLIQTDDEGFAVASGVFTLMRLNSQGDSLWTLQYEYGRYGESSLIQTEDREFVIAGCTFVENGDILLVKTTPDPVSISNDPFIPYPLSFSLLEPFPNPFNSSVALGFRTASPGIYALDLIDPTGRRLGIISEGFLPAGERRVVWNAGGTMALPAGNYFVRLTDTRGMQDVKPVVLVK